MKLRSIQLMLVGLAAVAIAAPLVTNASAQCTTCAVPTVAYQPVAAQPVVAYRPYTGWYPGKWLDGWRSRRLTTAVPVYAASYAPQQVAYNYAPQQVAYRPYITSFAPLAPACSSCVQTVARPVVLQPILNACSSTCGCDPCSCSACSAPVSQASYTEPACSSCAASGGPSYVTPPSSSGQAIVGPPTPQPQLETSPPTTTFRPSEGGQAPAGTDGNSKPEPQSDPGPADDSDASTFFDLRAPMLLDPSDRTARRSSSRKPTVDVWTAVYRRSTNAAATNTASQASQTRSQAGIDAEEWTAVEPRR